MYHDYTHPLTYAPRLYTPSFVCTKIIHTLLRMHQDYTHPLTYAPRLYTPSYVCTKTIHTHLRMHKDYTHPLTYMDQDNTPSYICVNTTTLLRMRQYNTYPSPYICIKMRYTLLRMHQDSTYQDDIHPFTYASRQTPTPPPHMIMYIKTTNTLLQHTLLRTHQDNTSSYICVKITHTLTYASGHGLTNPLTYISKKKHLPLPIRMFQDDVHPLTYAPRRHTPLPPHVCTKMTYTPPPHVRTKTTYTPPPHVRTKTTCTPLYAPRRHTPSPHMYAPR